VSVASAAGPFTTKKKLNPSSMHNNDDDDDDDDDNNNNNNNNTCISADLIYALTVTPGTMFFFFCNTIACFDISISLLKTLTCVIFSYKAA
jgi:hypothetical protein